MTRWSFSICDSGLNAQRSLWSKLRTCDLKELFNPDFSQDWKLKRVNGPGYGLTTQWSHLILISDFRIESSKSLHVRDLDLMIQKSFQILDPGLIQAHESLSPGWTCDSREPENPVSGSTRSRESRRPDSGPVTQMSRLILLDPWLKRVSGPESGLLTKESLQSRSGFATQGNFLILILDHNSEVFRPGCDIRIREREREGGNWICQTPLFVKRGIRCDWDFWNFRSKPSKVALDNLTLWSY